MTFALCLSTLVVVVGLCVGVPLGETSPQMSITVVTTVGPVSGAHNVAAINSTVVAVSLSDQNIIQIYSIQNVRGNVPPTLELLATIGVPLGPPFIEKLQDGPFDQAYFISPGGMAYDSVSNILYVMDTGNRVIRSVSLSAMVVGTVAGNHSATFSAAPVDGPTAALSAVFDSPTQCALLGRMLYFVEQTFSCILVLNLDTMLVQRFAGYASSKQTGGSGYLNGPRLQALFASIQGVTVSPNGDALWVADGGNRVIRKIDLREQQGNVTTPVGNHTSSAHEVSTNGFASSFVVEDASSTAFLPQSADVLLISGTVSNRIWAMNLTSMYVALVAGLTTPVPGSVDGPLGIAQLSQPRSLIPFADGALFINGQQNLRLVSLPGFFLYAPEFDGMSSSSSSSSSDPPSPTSLSLLAIILIAVFGGVTVVAAVVVAVTLKVNVELRNRMLAAMRARARSRARHDRERKAGQFAMPVLGDESLNVSATGTESTDDAFDLRGSKRKPPPTLLETYDEDYEGKPQYGVSMVGSLPKFTKKMAGRDSEDESFNYSATSATSAPPGPVRTVSDLSFESSTYSAISLEDSR